MNLIINVSTSSMHACEIDSRSSENIAQTKFLKQLQFHFPFKFKQSEDAFEANEEAARL